MSTPPFPDGARAHLGSPTLPVNAPGVYLRHRAATQRAYRERQRKLRLRRLVVLIVAAVALLTGGRELVQLVLAGANLATAQARSRAQGATSSTEKLLPPASGRGLSSATSETPDGIGIPAQEEGAAW